MHLKTIWLECSVICATRKKVHENRELKTKRRIGKKIKKKNRKKLFRVTHSGDLPRKHQPEKTSAQVDLKAPLLKVKLLKEEEV